MGGRGTYAAGNNVPYTYETVGKVHGVKVLRGIGGKHGLPEEAHSSNAYLQLNRDGTARTLRFYDDQHNLRWELAMHRERSIDPRNEPVLHYHLYDPKGMGKDWRGPAVKATKAMKKRWGKFFGRSWA